ncbi:microtubule-associated protein RP/EB family member 1-like [Arachis ipaensis]|uniref:microtubule-associated protein RP/EB family member 1-like n=1 Tax=Arachis ipaensis TaxID=130454 RepID=UPI0007AF4B03|nr:microtubule-associated protein RP/EB family member 1-like [Arachis ipaensis]XP_025670375.1 microtubule-associated protein RP/EB family member 1-like [Arachis hypogaea]
MVKIKMRKKVVHQKLSREKLLKFSSKPKPSTRSRDQTFTPTPSSPISPPRIDPMACTKNPSRIPSSSKPTSTLSAPHSAPSNPSTSKGKRPAAAEPTTEPTQPKPSSVPTRPQRDRDIVLNNKTISASLKYIDVGACGYAPGKWDEGVGISFKDALAYDENAATDAEEEDDSEVTGLDV